MLAYHANINRGSAVILSFETESCPTKFVASILISWERSMGTVPQHWFLDFSRLAAKLEFCLSTWNTLVSALLQYRMQGISQA